MKKMLILMLLCMLVITGCADTENGKSYENSDAEKNEVLAENEENAADADKTEKTIPSDEEIVNMYLDALDMWEVRYESNYAPNSYGYFMLDLDFDGVCELITVSNEGSGYFSHNNYYKVNLEDKTVSEIKNPEEGADSGVDWYISSEKVKLLRNTADNSLFYFCEDYIRSGFADYDLCYREFFVKDGEITTENVFYEHHNEKDENSENHTHIYRIYENGVEADLNESEYAAKKDEYFTRNVDMNLTWKTIDGAEFEKADAEERKAMLLESYSAFSYDGI